MQTLASRQLLRSIGIAEDMIISIDRDTIPAYDGEPVRLLMNACFRKRSFPIPEQIQPIFLGFQTAEPVIVAYRRYFEAHQPIGCRDIATMKLFKRHGISAFVTGCVTLTLDRSPVPDSERNDVLIVYGAGSGEFPAGALSRIPSELLERAQFVSQRMIINQFPLDEKTMEQAEKYSSYLLGKYKSARMVVTSLHHAATPSISLGVPVVLCRKSMDLRFSFLKKIMPVYIEGEFDDINWNAGAIDVSEISKKYRDRLRSII